MRHLEAVSEDTQELLSPKDGDNVDGGGTFALEPIFVSDDDVTDDENQTNDKDVVMEKRRKHNNVECKWIQTMSVTTVIMKT